MKKSASLRAPSGAKQTPGDCFGVRPRNDVVWILVAGFLISTLASGSTCVSITTRLLRALPFIGHRLAVDDVLDLSWETARRIRYEPCQSGESPIARAERILGVKLQGTKPIGKGGTRTVYLHPNDPSKLIKIVEIKPTKEGDPTEKAIKRQVWLNKFLTVRGFKVAKMEETPELWNLGIFIEENRPGTPLGKSTSAQGIENGKKLISELAKIDDPVYYAVFNRLGLTMLSALPVQSPYPKIGTLNPKTVQKGSGNHILGIDVGKNFENIHVEANDEVVLIDY